MAYDLKKSVEMWRRGYFNLPGRSKGLMDAFERAAYEQGERMRNTLRSPGPPRSAQTLPEAIESAFILAGAAGGVLLGLWRVGEGRGTWLGVLGLLVLGVLVGGFAHMLLEGLVRKAHEAWIWHRGRDERDTALLIVWWGEVFEAPILPHLVAEIDDGGRAWTVDGKNNFRLRTRQGTVFFIGRRPGSDGVTVEWSGRRTTEEEAYQCALAHLSLGHESLRPRGSKRNRRLMWAMARRVGLSVEGFSPDRKAMRLLERLKQDARWEAPGVPDPDGVEVSSPLRPQPR